eukprot:NODE_30182_length_425_cov_2.057047.p3 GENE.NODE_30182_length_425_cov_2.057047~~NODE_30182_length_425_cov_2.057047.p3  ORF type:complete len:78 (-),score=11.37 NODE_30182_length_425_cov_2.057047:27-260(-)
MLALSHRKIPLSSRCVVRRLQAPMRKWHGGPPIGETIISKSAACEGTYRFVCRVEPRMPCMCTLHRRGYSKKIGEPS